MNKKISGFTLVEIMIATGLLGLISLGVMQLTKQSTTTLKTTRIGVEIGSMTSKVQAALADKEHCNATFAAYVGAPLPTSLPMIKLRSGIPILEARKYNSSIKVKSILVTDQTATAPAAITINYEKIGMMVEGGRNVKDVITLQITKDASGNFLSCYSDVSNSILTAIDEAVMKACKAPGVKYNPVSKLCEVNPSLSDEMKCPSGQYLEKVQAVDVGAGEVRYVPTCRSKDMLCPAGQTGVIAPSGVVCNDNDCGAGRYLAGFDNVGNKICRDLINPSLANCVGGVGLSVDAAGRAQLTCCAADCTGATAHCAGTVFASANGCGTCSGTLAPNCSGASSICSGNSFPSTNSCGSCIGTMVSDCSAATTTCKGTVFVAANGCGTCTGTGPCENWLVNAQHKDVQCVGRGGVVVGGGPPFQFCKFSGNACPAGWTQYLSWSTTTPKIQTGVWKCNTGSHVFSNTAQEWCNPPFGSNRYAFIVEIGCY